MLFIIQKQEKKKKVKVCKTLKKTEFEIRQVAWNMETLQNGNSCHCWWMCRWTEITEKCTQIADNKLSMQDKAIWGLLKKPHKLIWL